MISTILRIAVVLNSIIFFGCIPLWALSWLHRSREIWLAGIEPFFVSNLCPALIIIVEFTQCCLAL
eukprot:scaffold25556_cov144-Skeletonema_dohrnii-CCMP3373.AAC.3